MKKLKHLYDNNNTFTTVSEDGEVIRKYDDDSNLISTLRAISKNYGIKNFVKIILIFYNSLIYRIAIKSSNRFIKWFNTY